jgi:hypothetical protein
MKENNIAFIMLEEQLRDAVNREDYLAAAKFHKALDAA